MMKNMIIPNGWEKKKMKDVAKWSSGGTPKSTEKSYYENGTIPWLVIGDLNDGIVKSSATKITNLGLKNSNAKMIPPGTLLIAMYGSIGKLGITGLDCCTNQAIAFATDLHGVTLDYLFYFMQWQKSNLISIGKGGTQNNISLSVLKAWDIVFPSIPKQERIVAKIEELFSQLDAAVTELKKVKEKLNVYRLAVYSSLFDSLDNLKPLSCFFDITGGLTKNSRRNLLPYKRPYLRVANVYYNKLDLNEIKEIGVTEAEIAKCSLKKDDLLFVEGNGSKSQIGRVALWDGSIDNCLHQNHLIKCRNNKGIIPRYALYFFMSQKGRAQILDVAKSTSGLYTLSVNKIKKLKIPFCGEDEQRLILDKVEASLSECNNISATIDVASQQATSLRQSILKLAFEGKL